MVSFKSLLLPLAAMATLAQAGSHAHHKRYQYRQYHNGTQATTVVTPTLLGTGIKSTEFPAVNSTVVETTLLPIFTPPPIQSAPVITVCITKYETKTYTYTLGNGKAHTTTITHTNVITQTVTPVLEPTKVDSVGGNTPGANAEENPDYTSTSTTTVFVTVTRTIPLPKETNPPIVVEKTSQTPCPVHTVYVTVPVNVSVSVIRETIVQTVKETITVTQNPVPESPVHTPPPAHPPYSNHTTIQTVHQVTLTVVPVPYQ
ncbi:hypothetical protein BGX38DRAFT_1138663 [Terfezia claveryi]|nr:hypothetical protein BGX38DRAFT_1138663 [Terfezia claveryi]